jgi:hypothetical protein
MLAGFAAGVVAAAGVEGDGPAVFEAGAAAGAAAGVDFSTGAVAAGGATPAGAEASAAAVFFDFEDFFAVVALDSLAVDAAAAVSAVSDFLLFVDFEAEELPLAAVAVSLEASAFCDLVDFFAVDESGVAELLAASDFFDLEVFFAVELSAAAAVSVVSGFLLLVDFLALEESAAAVSSAVVGFFFLDFAVLVSLWSVVAGVCDAWAAAAGRRGKFASRRAASRAKGNRLRIRFILGEFLSPAAIQTLCLAHGFLVPGVGGRGTPMIAARFFPVDLGEMMWEKIHDVKRGLQR